MKSRITIEVDFENGNTSVIQILQCPDSNDVRDKLIKHFTQQLGGSSWCQIKWKDGGHEFNRIHITPISPLELKSQSEIMLEQYNYHDKWLREHAKDVTKQD